MSARRRARERDTSVDTTDGVPAALLVGRLIEVWSPDTKPPDWWSDRLDDWVWASTSSRYSLVRGWWLASTGVGELPQDRPAKGGPWCLATLGYVGQAERVGRPVDEIVDEWLTEAGVTRADIPELRAEAQALYEHASRSRAAHPR